MTLSDDAVRYVADLANLRLSAAEVQRMAHDLGQILTHVEQLQELDTKGVEPMSQVLFDSGETALRQDVVRASLSNSDALANAQVSGAGYYKVPRVIER